MPLRIKQLAEEREKVFREDQFDPRLRTHKLKGKLKAFWSFSIDDKYRIIFELISKKEVWFHSVGSHAIYKFWD